MNNKTRTRQIVQGRLARFASIYSGRATEIRFEGSKVCTNQEGIIYLPAEFHRLSEDTERRALALVSHEMGHDFVNIQLKGRIEEGLRNSNSQEIFNRVEREFPFLSSALVKPTHKAKLDGFKLFNSQPEKIAKAWVSMMKSEIRQETLDRALSEPLTGWIGRAVEARLCTFEDSSFWMSNRGLLSDGARPFFKSEIERRVEEFKEDGDLKPLVLGILMNVLKGYKPKALKESSVSSEMRALFWGRFEVCEAVSSGDFGRDPSSFVSIFDRIFESLIQSFSVSLSDSVHELIKRQEKSLLKLIGGKVRTLLNAIEDPRQERQSMSRLEGTRIWFEEANDEAFIRWARKMETRDRVLESEVLTSIALIFYLERGEMSEFLDDDVRELLDLFKSENWETPNSVGMFDALNVASFVFGRQFALSTEEFISLLLNIDPPEESSEEDPEEDPEESSEDSSEESSEESSEGDSEESSEGDSEESSEGDSEESSEGDSEESSEGDSEESSEGDSEEDSEDSSEEDSEDSSEESSESDSSKSLRGNFVRLPDGRLGQVVSEGEDGELEVRIIK